MRTVLTTLLLAFLFISTTPAQPGPPEHPRPIEGVILIKFAPEALETPPQQLRLDVRQSDLSSGQYFLRVVRDGFADTRQVTVVR